MNNHVKQPTRLLVAVCLSLGLCLPLCAQKGATIDVTGPTIVAFFEPMTAAELKEDPDANEALSDFQFYAGKVRQPLAERGITFKEMYALRITIRLGSKTTMIAPNKVKVGYCLAAPGKEPYVQLGVMTDVGLLQVADKYFGLTTH
jgi:hypothetical protein